MDRAGCDPRVFAGVGSEVCLRGDRSLLVGGWGDNRDGLRARGGDRVTIVTGARIDGLHPHIQPGTVDDERDGMPPQVFPHCHMRAGGVGVVIEAKTAAGGGRFEDRLALGGDDSSGAGLACSAVSHNLIRCSETRIWRKCFWITKWIGNGSRIEGRKHWPKPLGRTLDPLFFLFYRKREVVVRKNNPPEGRPSRNRLPAEIGKTALQLDHLGSCCKQRT
jgi:hypothetical protein